MKARILIFIVGVAIGSIGTSIITSIRYNVKRIDTPLCLGLEKGGGVFLTVSNTVTGVGEPTVLHKEGE